MFTIDEATADGIRKAYEDCGELAAIVELRRHFPLFENNEHARTCVRSIVSWKPMTAAKPTTAARDSNKIPE